MPVLAHKVSSPRFHPRLIPRRALSVSPTLSRPAMTAPHPFRRSVVFACLLPMLIFSLATSLVAQSATGTIEGRVFNPASGAYVERVRLTVGRHGAQGVFRCRWQLPPRRRARGLCADLDFQHRSAGERDDGHRHGRRRRVASDQFDRGRDAVGKNSARPASCSLTPLSSPRRRWTARPSRSTSSGSPRRSRTSSPRRSSEPGHPRRRTIPPAHRLRRALEVWNQGEVLSTPIAEEIDRPAIHVFPRNDPCGACYNRRRPRRPCRR